MTNDIENDQLHYFSIEAKKIRKIDVSTLKDQSLEIFMLRTEFFIPRPKICNYFLENKIEIVTRGHFSRPRERF